MQVIRLPQQIICNECGAKLYGGTEIVSLSEIVQRFDGKCPKCGKVYFPSRHRCIECNASKLEKYHY